jgi:hypothetical protein
VSEEVFFLVKKGFFFIFLFPNNNLIVTLTHFTNRVVLLEIIFLVSSKKINK